VFPTIGVWAQLHAMIVEGSSQAGTPDTTNVEKEGSNRFTRIVP